jgi:SAM-dependent methyltransferase
MDDDRIRALLHDVRQEFPKPLRIAVPELVGRDVWHVRLAYVPHGRVIDLGGGYSPTSVVLARLGMDVTVVDTFASTKFYEQFSEAQLREVLERHGVKVIKQDLLQYDPVACMPLNSVDSVVSHGTLGFFHPRALLEGCVAVLKPGGTVALDFDNALSLLRRIRVALGNTNVDAFDPYFFQRILKRYWTAAELPALAKHLQLAEARVVGRNWSVYQSRKHVPRLALRFADHALRAAPGLCNDIYLIGRK